MTTTLLLFATLSAGTYSPKGEDTQRTATLGKKTERCHAVAPSASFTVHGPASPSVVVYVDLLAKPPKPAPVKLTVTLDGKGKPQVLKPKRAPKAKYDSGEAVPSAPAKPIKLKVPAGEHTVTVALPEGTAGCVVLHGITLQPADEPAEAQVAQAAVEPPAPPPAPTAKAALPEPELVAALPAPAPPTGEPSAKPAAAEPEPALVAAPREVHASSSSAPEEIHAAPIGETLSVEAGAAPPGASPAAGSLRLGLVAGGVLPRAELRAGFMVGLLAEVSFLPLAPGMDLMGHASLGFSPLRQQDTAMIPGSGQTELIQESKVFPIDLGATLRLDLGLPVQPYGTVALAIEVVRTELRAFSRPPVQQNDVAIGPALATGAYLPLGPGGAIAELRYRELGADIGTFEEVGENTLSRAALQLGYLLAF